MVREFRAQDPQTPIVLMGYANPVERMGYAAFADQCAEAGVDGVITVDLPPEEVDKVNVELARVGIDNIFLISPTTPDARIQTITDRASGFIYYVAVKGVTGAGHLDTADVAAHVAKIRAATALPVAVGFGIKDATSAATVAAVADGVVVGSALIQCVADARAAGAVEGDALAQGTALMASIRRGVDGVGSAA
jgi:tryptophan synthase alpha chain